MGFSPQIARHYTRRVEEKTWNKRSKSWPSLKRFHCSWIRNVFQKVFLLQRKSTAPVERIYVSSIHLYAKQGVFISECSLQIWGKHWWTRGKSCVRENNESHGNVVASSGKQEHVRKHPVKPVSSLNIVVGLFYDQIPAVQAHNLIHKPLPKHLSSNSRSFQTKIGHPHSKYHVYNMCPIFACHGWNQILTTYQVGVSSNRKVL